MRALTALLVTLVATTASADAAPARKHRRLAPAEQHVVTTPVATPARSSGFDVPSTAGTSLIGAPLTGGGRLSGRIE